MKILVAMSGGVDSSVVAHLLKEEGHDLVGVMMKMWTDPLAPEVRNALPSKCCSLEHIQRARMVCRQLDIPFYVLNLEKEFKKEVVDPFLKGYKEGKTPNPCIECNRTIKFGRLLDKAEELGCDKLATGHYARIIQSESNDSVMYKLLEAKDKTKDQSYYLYSLTQKKLSRILFPLGSLEKEDVFRIARKYGIPIPDYYAESQDLCFYPEREPEAFLRRYIPDTKQGDIKTEDGTVVGTHKGLPFYTIGQRKGLHIGGLRIPLHVVSKEQKSNTIFVAPNGADMKDILSISNIEWISNSPSLSQDEKFDARIHSLGKRQPGTLKRQGSSGTFHFENRIRGIAPGQYIVLYKGDELVAGGLITE